MIPYSSLYEILNVPGSASTEEIKSAFRKLALIHHPDKNNNSPESEANFILIRHAYAVLSDPTKRGEYDSYLKNSSVLKDWKKAQERKTGAKAVLTAMTGSPYSSAEMVFSHLNFLLWEIEDFLRDNYDVNWNRLFSGKPLVEHILNTLIFIDKWVLYPAGYQDYFLEARKISVDGIAEHVYNISFGQGKLGHRPFVNCRDYFYNIRKRMDKFIKHTTISNLITPIQECGIRLIDGIFEAENLTIHNLCFLNRILAGETEYLPPFQYSNPCFEN